MIDNKLEQQPEELGKTVGAHILEAMKGTLTDESEKRFIVVRLKELFDTEISWRRHFSFIVVYEGGEIEFMVEGMDNMRDNLRIIPIGTITVTWPSKFNWPKLFTYHPTNRFSEPRKETLYCFSSNSYPLRQET